MLWKCRRSSFGFGDLSLDEIPVFTFGVEQIDQMCVIESRGFIMLLSSSFLKPVESFAGALWSRSAPKLSTTRPSY
jgi:hypothetical protein